MFKINVRVSVVLVSFTAQKMKFSIKDFIVNMTKSAVSHLLKKSLMEGFIFCPVFVVSSTSGKSTAAFQHCMNTDTKWNFSWSVFSFCGLRDVFQIMPNILNGVICDSNSGLKPILDIRQGSEYAFGTEYGIRRAYIPSRNSSVLTKQKRGFSDSLIHCVKSVRVKTFFLWSVCSSFSSKYGDLPHFWTFFSQ